MKPALVLAAHGSHLDANASTPVWAHAARLVASARFDGVYPAFWKEEPSLSRVLDGVRSDDVTVVPVFMADGYFVREVVPREMGFADGPCVAGKRIRYSRPIGAAPQLADVIRLRAWEAGAGDGWALALLGHGTPRSKTSGGTTVAQAEHLIESGELSQVVPLFLDDEPNIRDVFTLLPEGDIVVVPFFIADGWHVGTSIPQALAMEGAAVEHGGRRLVYARAVGTHAAVADIIAELADEAAAGP